MSFAGIFTKYSRFLFKSFQQCATRNFFTDITPLAFRITDVLLGEPPKRKKKIDPAVIRRREERKARKIQKAIRQLEKHARKLKPIGECEIPYRLADEKEARTREPPKLSEELIDKRVLLQKDFARYKRLQHIKDMEIMDNMIISQENALNELRAESEELYQAAIQLDIPSMLPHSSKGPLTTTPAITDYPSPDGEYINVTKKYDGEDEIEKLIREN